AGDARPRAGLLRRPHHYPPRWRYCRRRAESERVHPFRSGSRLMPNRFSWSTALKIAVREARASRAKFLFVILAVAAGVGSLTGVRGFSTSFRTMLLRDARTLMAADLTARLFALPNESQMGAIRGLEARGVPWTWVTETVTRVSSATVHEPVLISVKAVDPKLYPF